MNDSTAFNGAMNFYDKTMTTIDDVLRALIAALAQKSNDEQKKILDAFSKHLEAGHGLNAVALDRDRMNAFARYAKQHNLTYYSAKNRVTGAYSVIYKDHDEVKVQKVAEEMREDGIELFLNPQRSFSDFCRDHDADQIMYQRVKSLDDVLLAKQSLAAQDVEFSLAKNEDASCIVAFDRKDTEAIQKSGMVHEESSPAAFSGNTSLQDIRLIVREKRERENREKEKQNYQDRGR